MKLIPVVYYGFTAMDRRFSTPMLPWVVSEIRRRNYNDKLSLGIEDGILQAYNQDFELQFSHKVWQITRFSQADQDPLTFLYLMRDDNDALLYCYLFQGKKINDVSDLYKQMKDQSNQVPPTRSVSSAANLTSLCVDISPSSSNFFEVLYIGKIKVWQKKVPDTFIDDALERFKVHELEKQQRKKMLGNIGRLKSEITIRRGSTDSTSSVESGYGVSVQPPPQLQRSMSSISHLTLKSTNNERNNTTTTSDIESESNCNSTTSANSDNESLAQVGAQTTTSSSSTTTTTTNDNKMNADIDDHNRTMVLQVDRTDLRLISPDRKVILLHKQHKDIATCLQGLIKSEHFGFICREGINLQTYTGYIFKCESASIATDAVQAITQSCLSSSNDSTLRSSSSSSNKSVVITSCDHCPMVWYHKLCTEIENLTDRKTQAAILRRIEQLDDDEQNLILTKFHGVETESIREQNEFLMMLLRAHCEMKQNRHIHDTIENRSEFLNQYLGGGTIFMKAKRSLTNSFEMLKRKASKDDFSSTLKEMNLPINRESSPHSPSSINNDTSDRESLSDGMRSRSSTIGSQNDIKDSTTGSQHLNVNRDNNNKCNISPDRSIGTGSDKGSKSPMMDIFLKVGSSPKSSTTPPIDDQTNTPSKLDTGSWRQAIFKRVITPNKQEQQQQQQQNERDSKKLNKDNQQKMRRTKDELRDLWRKSIYQAILLVRMEKENKRLKVEQEESAIKRIKLEYDEMKPSQREVMEVWDMVTSKDPRMKCDNQMLLHAIRQGIPRGKRGEVWQFLAEQYNMKVPPIDTTHLPNYNVPYEHLLKQLTAHQHAILIDLGRTFPNHSYFSSPLGPGQLSLFNLLKAYSLLDTEMGYCQGLSFIAGILLLHLDETQAFNLLKHLMFKRNLREQYLPNMIGLQIKLYQLSRLLHDHLPDLYNHFDLYEVSPTLYAAPWLLTIFSSQFPLGFVTRVFDLIFLENSDVVFKVILSLLSLHKEKLLLCDSFEEIMNYLKNNLPAIDRSVLDKIMKQVYTTDIAKQLNEYQVEYHVLQEEMTSVQPQFEQLHELEKQNKILTEQNKNLMSQLELALSNVQRLEKTRTLQQSQLNRLEMNSRSLNVTIATLSNFINNLVEEKIDIEISDDVHRILSQFNLNERRKTNELKPQNNNLMKMFQTTTTNNPNIINQDKLMVKSLSTGKIPFPTSLENEQNMLRSNSLNSKLTPTSDKPSTSQQQQQKVSPFFSTSHHNILQQKFHSNSTANTLSIPNLLNNSSNSSNTTSGSSSSSNAITKTDNKAVVVNNETEKTNRLLTLNEENSKISPTSSVDSGLETPSSPQKHLDHPLSNCDVNFIFNGTKELKSIKSLRNISRNCSPDIVGK